MRAVYELEWLGLSEYFSQDGHRQLDSLFRQQTCFLPTRRSALVEEAPWCSLWSLWSLRTSPMRPVDVPEGKLWLDSHGWLSATAQK